MSGAPRDTSGRSASVQRIVAHRSRVPSRAGLLWGLAVVLVVGYGAYLRADATVGKFGPFSHPRWMVAMQDGVLATRAHLVPADWSWTRQDPPYGRGDPVNYIIFARQMTSFYQAHVREPMFLVVTRAFMAVADNQDVAVSLASATCSSLAVFATFLLGSAVATRGVGLAAAALAAVERDLVHWAPDGWRDDAFTAIVALSAWAVVRLYQRPTWGRAVLLGVIGAGACLTRITALSFLLPAFVVLLALRTGPEWRPWISRVLLAGALMVVLVAPYLINCYRVTGDAFFAISEHTRFYRASQGLPYDKPMGALAYTAFKFRLRPVAEVDTAFRGLFVHPLADKSWRIAWLPASTRVVFTWLAVAGLVLWIWLPSGRLALLLLHASLVPYMLTWALPGGGEWRFTMHTYPFYFTAAAAALWTMASIGRSATREQLRQAWRSVARRRRLAWQIAAAAVIAAVGSWWYVRGPAFVLTEALRTGNDVSVHTGPNDAVFFRQGWSGLSTTGAVVSRFATDQTVTVYVPLPERRPYRLVFRMDPLPRADGEMPQQVAISLGEQRLAEVDLVLDTDRVGSYPVIVPADLAGQGLTRFVLTARQVRRAGTDAAPYAGITADTSVAFLLWYVRVSPQ